MNDIFKIPVFPATDVGPMMADDQLAELAADIKQNKLRHPLVIAEVADADGVLTLMLIDGRNRRAACKMAGITPDTRTLNGEDPTAFVVSTNLHRLHLSKGQRAMNVAMIYPEPEKVKRAGSSISEQHHIQKGKLSEARTVLAYSKPLARKVLDGATPLSEAYDHVKAEERKDKQKDKDTSRLRLLAPDLADRVEAEEITLAEANTLYRERDEEQRQIRSTVFSSLRVVHRALKSFTVVGNAVASLPDWLDVEDYADEFKQQAGIRPAELGTIIDEMQCGLDRLKQVAESTREK